MRAILRPLSLALAIAMLTSIAVTAAPRLYSLGLQGLACPVCALRVKRSLSALNMVQDVQIDFRTGKAFVTVAEGATLTEAEARAAVESAGFTLQSFEEQRDSP